VNPQELLIEAIEMLKGMWRFRWWAVAATWAISLAGWTYVAVLPDTYLASARVYVDTNSLLKPLMEGLTAQPNTMSEVQLVSTAVLTRPNLEAVARQTDLDLRAHTPEEFETLVTGLQTRVTVSGGRDNIFRIQYEDSSREKARDVVAAVLDTFVEGAQSAQGDDTEVTEKALAGEIAEHEERLRSAENALASFKTANLGYMPGDTGGYYERLQSALDQVAGGEERVRLLTEKRTELARQVEGEEPVFGIMPVEAGSTASCSQSGHLAELERSLDALLVDFTEKHPRVVALQETIATLKARCQEEVSVMLATGITPRQSGSEPLEVNPVYQNLRLQLSQTDVDLAESRGKLRSYESAVAQLRRDVDKIAQVETELKQLNRDYDVISGRHQELIRRWEDLQARKRLDPVTDNVQFRRIEPPFALADPVGPNRPLLLTGVLVAALVAGGALAFGLNHLRPVYFSRRSLRATGVPVLGAVGMMLTPGATQQKRLAAAAWASAYLLLLVSTGAVILFSSQAAQLLRALAPGGSL